LSRGISEIVATLMMIVIVSSIGIALFVYSTGYFSGTTSAMGEVNRLNVNTVRERFLIVDTLVRSGASTEVSAAVYNYGRTTITIEAMFLNGTRLTLSWPVEIMPGEWAWVNGSTPFPVSSGSICSVRVASSLGNVYEAMVRT